MSNYKSFFPQYITLAFLLLTLFACSSVGDNLVRPKVSEALALTSSVKMAIVEQYSSGNGQLSDVVVLNKLLDEQLRAISWKNKPVLFAYKEVTVSGVIRLYSQSLGVFIQLSPDFSTPEQWRCEAYPHNLVPQACQIKKSEFK